MDRELQMKIEQAKVVSFDVFDTLIVRTYKKPADLFRHIEKSESMEGFAEERVSAEMRVRTNALKQSQRKEVTLGEIYRAMDIAYAPLMEKEIELEKLACRQNPEMKAVYDECISKGKRVLIASDMYLPQDVIEEILSKNGYTGYEKLFLSSVTMHPKATGDMYQDILDYTSIPAGETLHIGDHPYTDSSMAKKSGFNSYLYFPIRETAGNIPNALYFASLNRYDEESLVPSLLEGFISLHGIQNPQETYWESFGYKYAGIMALGYMRWLKEQLGKKGIKKVFFMMRDGYIFKKVFDRLYTGFDTKEIYGSRSMFMLPGMESYEDLRIHITGVHRQGLTYRRCYDRLGVENEDLWQAYEQKFADLDAVILKDEEFEAVDSFFKDHEEILKKIGKRERENLLKYFDAIGLLKGKCAIVDLGWKCSMLKGIEKLCRLEGRKSDLVGFYLGTHEYTEDEMVQAVSFGMEQGRPKDKRSYLDLLKSVFIVEVMELMFTAPFPSALKMNLAGNEIIPVYQEPCDEEKVRIKVSAEILSGVMSFVEDFCSIDTAFEVPIGIGDAFLPIAYLGEHLHKKDVHEINKIHTIPSTGSDSFSFPTFKGNCCRFGLVSTWPGAMSAEAELILRIKRGAVENGFECVPIDNFGRLLDAEGLSTSNFVDAKSLDFIISIHYYSPKLLDSYYYFTIWNPPEIPLGENDASVVIDNYLSFDDYLIFDEGGMKNHLRSLLTNCPRDIDGASSLMTSFPASAIMEPNLDNPKLFYCGMNWDVLKGDGKGRNEGVMKLLDKQGILKIFGPDVNPSWGGVRPWAGYQCYQHPIPFDGFSLLKELNDCGVCLVFSSDVHRRAGAVTTRAFEACTAGAVMISDDNPTMKKMFGDAALFVDFNRNDPQDTCRQVVEKYQWILTHKKEAKAMAKRAQKIFLEKYSLDVYLKEIVRRHAKRFDTIGNSLFAKAEKDVVLAAYVCNTSSIDKAKELITKVLANVNNQLYKAIVPVIAANETISSELEVFAKKICASAQVVPMPLYDKFGARNLTNGMAVTKIRDRVPHKYFVFASAGEDWFYDHITSLIRTLEDHPEADVSYSGQIVKDSSGAKFVHAYELLTENTLLSVHPVDMPRLVKYPFGGCFLFRDKCHLSMPDYLFDCTDGHEYLLYLHILLLKEKRKAVFSKRLTFGFGDFYADSHNLVISSAQENAFIFGLTKYDACLLPTLVSAPKVVNQPVTTQIKNPYNLDEDPYARFAFPYKAVAPGSNIIIYGGGIVGKVFLWQVSNSSYCHVVSVCDKKPAETGIQAAQVISVEELAGLADDKYDCVVIAMERKTIAMEVRSDLEMCGISAKKIKWLNPRKDGVVLQ